jgi:hypothetical protein
MLSLLLFFLIFIKRHRVIHYLCLLEYIVVFIYYYLWVFLFSFELDFLFLVSFLVLSVCEGCLGLGLIVIIVRRFGEDYCRLFIEI